VARVFLAKEGGLPATDRGLAYGDGLFETIRVEGARAPLLSKHLDRLARDARRLGIAITRNEVQRIASEALVEGAETRGDEAWVLKLIVTRGAGGRGYRPDPDGEANVLVLEAAAPPPPPAAGVRVDFSRVPLTVNPLLCGIKSLNRLEQVLAAKELEGDLFEVLMSNNAGDIVEGTRTNLFVDTDEGWRTPPAHTLAVSGVMRAHVLACLQQRGEPVFETTLSLADLMSDSCRGVYLTNAVLGIVPVAELAGQALPVNNRLATVCGLPTEIDGASC